MKRLNDNRYSQLLNAIDAFIPGTKHLIELRNFQEHPGDKVTYIENFSVTSENEIGYPVWFVKGKNPEPIIPSMKHAIEFIISMAEAMLTHYLLASPNSDLPYCVEEIPEDKIDPKKPIRYRLSIDLGAMQFKR